MRRGICSLLCFGLLLATTLVAYAEKRVALVIGNGAYANAAQLPNPRNDAEDVAAALERSGFDTVLGVDLDQSQMQEAAIAFARAAREADVALFYYSGHAMQFGGVNYLMPVDAKLSDEADLRRMARVDDILADLQQAKNLRILVLDACRDNPFAEQLKRSIGLTRAVSLQRGLAKIDTPEGMIVAFSTQAQHTADDGAGRNSPYTAAFLKHIEEQDEIGRVFRHISSDVYEGTDHKQLPELSLSIIGDYYLQGEPESPSAPAKVAVLVPQPGAPRTPVQPAVVTVPKPEVLFGPEPSQPPSTATPQNELGPTALGGEFPCSMEHSLRSLAGDHSVMVTFRNLSNKAISTYWLDYMGKRVLYQRINGGASYSQQTFISHPWVLVDSSGQCRKIILPGTSESVVTIR